FFSLFITYQDWKSRSIHILLFMGYLLSALLHIWYKPGWNWFDPLFNLAFVLVLVTLSIIVLRSFRKIRTRESIGSGDLIYLLITLLFFKTYVFIVALNISFIVSLLFHLIALRVSDTYKAKNLIPLAGFQAPVFTLFYLMHHEIYPIESFF
ncbi:MAG: hypothetical protein AAF789_06750, partial [Bacteroidota bacterium]